MRFASEIISSMDAVNRIQAVNASKDSFTTSGLSLTAKNPNVAPKITGIVKEADSKIRFVLVEFLLFLKVAMVKRFQVRHGLGVMPSFKKDEISNDELDDILSYLKALRKNN